jgi:RNA polymerase primary sigma factor
MFPMQASRLIDDPARLYLNQIGKTPLLSANGELTAARRIEQSRAQFRRLVLSSGYVLQKAVAVLIDVQAGHLRFDRVIDVSARDQEERRRVELLLSTELARIQELAKSQRDERHTRPQADLEPSEQQLVRRNVVRDRREIVRFLDRCNLRTECLVERFNELSRLSKTMDELQSQPTQSRQLAGKSKSGIEQELAYLSGLAQDSPAELRWRVARLREYLDQFNHAKQVLTRANLRLVVSIAKRYKSCASNFLDLIQEGNLGLMRAVERYDLTQGHRFSSFASMWIRHAITRSLIEREQPIRLPKHQIPQLNRLRQTQAEFLQAHGRSPSAEECAEITGMPLDDVTSLVRAKRLPTSLDASVTSSEGVHLGDTIVDERGSVALEEKCYKHLCRSIDEALQDLGHRERTIVQLRFGLADGNSQSLAAIGNRFSLSRERIRQIEAKSIDNLRGDRRLAAMIDEL